MSRLIAIIGNERQQEMRLELVKQAFGAYLRTGGAPTFGAYMESIGLAERQDEPTKVTLQRAARIREKAKAYA